MEYAGMIIYHKKLDSDRFKLPEFNENTTYITINWQDLIMMVESVVISYERTKPKKQKKQPVRLPIPDDVRREDELIEPEGID